MQELVSLGGIELSVSVANWQDAVIKSGAILLNNGYIIKEYVNTMIRTVKSLGPYIVMTPGLAMPRARGTSGVVKSGISIMTLLQPVEFGNESNDPVYLLIGLAGSNDDLCLKVMQAIATIFGDDRMLEWITACDRREMVARILNDVEMEE